MQIAGFDFEIWFWNFSFYRSTFAFGYLTYSFTYSLVKQS